MAMLAEPRKKTKYRLQPYSGFSKTNKRCDDDTSSFGFKLMASMGWAPGKGLGANESGNVDPIKLRLKNDDAGLGYKVSEDDALAQQSEFQALLLQLNAGSNNQEVEPEVAKKKSKKPKIKSLEKQSAQSTRRVHYKKFTRSKDLSRASDKDLRSILGLSSETSETSKGKELELEEPQPVEESNTESDGANMYVTAGSSVDYFKKRHREKKNALDVSENDRSVKEDCDKSRRSVTWGSVDVSYVDKYIKDIVDTSGSVDESLDEGDCEVAEKNSPEVFEENIERNGTLKNKKKKRKRKRNEEENCEKSLVHEQEDKTEPQKKKRRKSKVVDEGELIADTQSDVQHTDTDVLCPKEDVTYNKDLAEKPKLKKKKKKKNKVCALPDQTEQSQ